MTRKSIDPTISAAIITVVGGIVTTLIITLANRPAPLPPTPIPTAVVVHTVTASPTVVPTDTVPPGDPTSTPMPPTDTPVPTATPVPPVDLGVDWTEGCISTLWKPYPADVVTVDKGNGCWQEPVGNFTADQGSLFMAHVRNERGLPDVNGLFALMPERGDVSFTVRLKKMGGIDFITGIFTDRDVTRPDFVLSIPGDGNVNKLRIVQKDNIVNYNTITGTALLDQGNGYSITFTFSESNVSGKVNPFVFVFDPIPLPSAQKWLFIGYKSGAGAYEVDIEVSSLALK